MSTSITFTALTGASGEEPLCSLLTIDGYNILLDCGWTYDFEPESLAPLARVAQEVDLVLLSHPDVAHLGALAYAVSRLQMPARVYATTPVMQLGQMFMYDAYLSLSERERFEAFSLDDIDNTFERVTTVRYLQRVRLPDKGRGIEITAYAAGHMLGGTVWRIAKETEEVVYAVAFNHAKERHLNRTVLEILRKPALLITDSYNGLVPLTSRKSNAAALTEDIVATLRRGGNVLIPTDTSGRSLELALLIEQLWAYKQLGGSFGLALLTNFSYDTFEFAKSLSEWMSDSISRSLDQRPFTFRHLRLAHSFDEIKELPRPMCVLASEPSLTPSFCLDLFMSWAPEPANKILFTDRGLQGTLSRKLIDSLSSNSIPPSITIPVWKRVEVPPEELQASKGVVFEDDELTAPGGADDAYVPGAPTEEDSPKQPDAPADTAPTSTTPVPEHSVPISALQDPFERSFDATPADFAKLGYKHPMFPYKEPQVTFDAYGEVIDTNQYSIEGMRAAAAPAAAPPPAEGDVQMSDSKQPLVVRQHANAARLEAEKEERKMKTKWVREEHTVELKCSMRYIEFEGLSDGQSIKRILANVAPRRLILIGGTNEASAEISSWAEEGLKGVCRGVYRPSAEEPLEVPVDAATFRAFLPEDVIGSTQFTKAGNYELAYVAGELEVSEEQGKPPLLRVQSGGLRTEASRDHVFVGDFKLNDFAHALNKAGLTDVRLEQGIIVINSGAITVRKGDVDGTSEVVLDGVISDDFYKVRELLHSQYSIV